MSNSSSRTGEPRPALTLPANWQTGPRTTAWTRLWNRIFADALAESNNTAPASVPSYPDSDDPSEEDEHVN